ncbi:tetratricopeptide repeat protein [Enhygromyxa salina]|uniref:Tetratricopeptide repeat protein n=1 Tax=Enhygromyxa salina TaxID=215803 RepID=A0A2S9YYQ4_9BACT|nr:tetratricopeptide repeat protein [Enhygromyxa salina]PRQ10216.1 Tetratricopeptide repeat protein [Enhygromyxa salina]
MQLKNRRLLPLSLSGLLLVSGCAYFKNSQSKLEEAQIALNAGDEATAEALYRDTMRSKGKDSVEARALLVNLLINRGGRLMSDGKPDDAMGHLREALSLDATRDESRIAYARALMKVERYTEAIDTLMEGKGCRGCKTMIAVIYLERGQAGVRDGEYADALADFELALGMNRDPITVLNKVDVYTLGHYGTGAEAVGYLDHAQRLMPPDQVGAQQVWWDKRTAIIYNAALAHEDSAISAALALPDPRKKVDAAQRIIDKFELSMYAASLQIYARDYDQGTERGLATYAEAEGAIPDAELAKLRETLMSLFMQRAAIHLAADEDAAARKILAQALELDPGNRTLSFQNIIATAARSTGEARKLLAKWEADEAYPRLRALLELVYVRNMMGIGQFTAARAGLERAERYAPDLLDNHLARAELEAQTRFEGLKTVWYERYRELETFSYPAGRINYYGRALAQVRFVQAAYDDAAARDYLRIPAFETRLTQLEKTITEFYPYDAVLAPADKPDMAGLLLDRKESGEFEVKIAGPKTEHVIKVAGESQSELELGTPGLAVVNAPTGPKAVFAEPGVKIIVGI